MDQIQAVADLAEVAKGCVVEEPEHPTVVRLPQPQHHRQEPKRKQRLHVWRVHDVVDRRCLRSETARTVPPPARGRPETSIDEPRRGSSRRCPTYPQTPRRPPRPRPGIHRRPAESAHMPPWAGTRRRGSESRWTRPTARATRTASHAPAAGRKTTAGKQDRTALRRTTTRSGCRTSASGSHGVVQQFRLDPRVEEDPPVHHVQDICRQVGDADRGRRQSQHEIVGGEDPQRAARVEVLEHLPARPVLERDQDSGDQESADHKEERDAITAPPEVRDIAVHQEHRQESEEPKSIDLFAMFQRLHVSRARGEIVRTLRAASPSV